MVYFPNQVSAGSGVKETQYVQNNKEKASDKVVPVPQAQSSIDTNDKNNVKSYAAGSSPSSVNFGEEEPKEIHNPLAITAATLFALLGTLSGVGGYCPEIFDALNEQLKKTAAFLSKHGQAVDIDFLGNVRAKKQSEKPQGTTETA